MKSAARFKTTQVSKQSGELARIKIIQGADQGYTFVVMGQNVVMGRGENSDVMLRDMKCSRSHAQIYFRNGSWFIKDLESINGVQKNGKLVTEESLYSGDIVVVGETSFEFVSAQEGTMVLTAPPRSAEDVQKNILNLNIQDKKIEAISSFGGLSNYVQPKSTQSVSGMESNKKKPLLLAIGLVVIIFVVFSEDKPKKAQINADREKKVEELRVARDLASYLPKSDGPMNKTVEMFYLTGFREFREGNYLRAKNQFETVLQIDPNHKLAKYYLKNCELKIEDEISGLLIAAKNAKNIGKYKSAEGLYETVMRLLYRDQSNPSYIEAQRQLENVRIESQSRGGGA